jgi:2-polyprenyl-6-methoxyphenol hydroxylase-like FAD-dependent oxidoreductase
MTGGRRATVVGGGIAGLSAAAALTRAGWEVTVLERAPAFGEVGAGLAVTANGMAALDALGAGAQVRDLGYATAAAGTRDRRGRWLLRLPPAQDPDPVTRAWGVHRQRLHGALLTAAGDADLVTGATVTSAVPGTPEREPAVLRWRDEAGEHVAEADLVVAADGIRSTLRGQLFPDAALRYSGRSSWRAVIDDPDTARDGFVAWWGPQSEFGAVRISRTQVYWYGYVRFPAGVHLDDELGAAVRHFSGWSPQVRGVLAATRADQLLRHDVHHLPGGLPGYVRGRVVVVGDAAHAMLPTMGQGANTSLEDGVCVGRLVAGPVAAGAPMAGALAAFDAARRPRCRQIAQRSALTARFGAHVPGGLPQVLRNSALRLVPAGPAVAAGAGVLRWAPP